MARTYERLVVEELARIMTEKGLDPPTLGKMAFSGERARKIVGQLLHGYQFESARGKIPSLKIRDFWSLCNALDVSPAEVLGSVSLTLKRAAERVSTPQKKQRPTQHRLILIVSNHPE